MLKQMIQGMVVGIANIIPGVSGGTMLVAMGVYDKLIHAVTHIKSEFKKSMKLLAPILIGAALAIVILSRVFEYLFENYPIPTNFAFCGLILGSLPAIFENVKGYKVSISKILPFILFFALVIGMALIGESKGADAQLTLSFVNVCKLFGVGVIAAATMVVPGVSGSMILMVIGYYDVILASINDFIDSLIHLDTQGILTGFGILFPFGIGVLVGIVVIAKLIEFVFQKARVHAYYAILGLIVASPIAILINVDWSQGSLPVGIVSVIAFALGWVIASRLSKD